MDYEERFLRKEIFSALGKHKNRSIREMSYEKKELVADEGIRRWLMGGVSGKYVIDHAMKHAVSNFKVTRR